MGNEEKNRKLSSYENHYFYLLFILEVQAIAARPQSTHRTAGRTGSEPRRCFYSVVLCLQSGQSAQCTSANWPCTQPGTLCRLATLKTKDNTVETPPRFGACPPRSPVCRLSACCNGFCHQNHFFIKYLSREGMK